MASYRLALQRTDELGIIDARTEITGDLIQLSGFAYSIRRPQSYAYRRSVVAPNSDAEELRFLWFMCFSAQGLAGFTFSRSTKSSKSVLGQLLINRV